MKIDEFIKNAIMEKRGFPYQLKSAIPQGLSLLLTFYNQNGVKVEIKIYPAGESSLCSASNENFDIIFPESFCEDQINNEKQKIATEIVDFLLNIKEKFTLNDWEETLGESADFRFICGNAAEIKITRQCNQNCVFCKSAPKLENYASFSQMPDLLRRLVKKTDFLTLSGGETCIEPNLPDLIAEARKAGFKKVEVQTNGMLLKDKKLLKKLINAGMTNALVSLHSHIPEISDKITGCKGGFYQTMEGLKNLSMENISLSLCHVICSLNVDGIPDYVRFVKSCFKIKPVSIVFTLAIPTYKVREKPELMPRLKLIAPFLKQGLSMCNPSFNFDRRKIINILTSKSTRILIDRNSIFKTLKNFLLVLLSQHKRAGVRARIISHCGIPLCIMSGFEIYHDEFWSSCFFPAESDLFHPEICSKCLFKPNCSGIWKTYASVYGTDEIKPAANLTKSPFP